MAVPLISWLALAAMAAGSYSQYRSRDMKQDAVADQMRLLGERLRKQSDNANEIFEQSLAEQDAGTQQQAIDTAADDKIARVERLIDTQGFTPQLPGQDTASRVVKDSVQGKLSDAIARARARVAAQAELEGFGSRTFDRGVQLQRRASDFGDIAANARGARQLYDTGVYAAQQKGSKQALIGDVLVALGQAGLLTAGLPSFGGVEKVVPAASATGSTAPARFGTSVRPLF